MMRFAQGGETCRRILLERHFGLPESGGDCGACDACTEASPWLAANARSRPARSAAHELSARFQRGDWVRIDGRHLGHVVRVEGEGRGLRLVVESAGDFRHRTIDPRRSLVEPLRD